MSLTCVDGGTRTGFDGGTAPTPPPEPPPLPDPPPDPAPDPLPEPTGDIEGFGRGSVGGTGGSSVSVSTLAALRAACASPDPLIITWIGGIGVQHTTAEVKVASYKTVDFKGFWIGTNRLRLNKGAHDVIIKNARFRVGGMSGYQEDACTVGDFSGATLSQDLAFKNCEFAWAPDVVAVLLGRDRRVTFQDCAFYEGLYESPHDESPGHSDAMNIEGVPDISRDAPAYVTVLRCLFAYTVQRMPRVIGTKQFEGYNNFIVDAHEGPQGIPVSARWENNRYLRIGSWDFLGTYRDEVFRYQPDASYGPAAAGQVYHNGNTAEGFTLSTSGAILTTSAPSWSRSVSSLMASTDVEAFVMQNVGAFPRDAYMAALMADIDARNTRPALRSIGDYPPVPI